MQNNDIKNIVYTLFEFIAENYDSSDEAIDFYENIFKQHFNDWKYIEKYIEYYYNKIFVESTLDNGIRFFYIDNIKRHFLK